MNGITTDNFLLLSFEPTLSNVTQIKDTYDSDFSIKGYVKSKDVQQIFHRNVRINNLEFYFTV